MTNFEKYFKTPEDAAKFLDSVMDDQSESYDPIGCYSCAYYQTHHADPGSSHYACGNCEWKNGILGWFKAESEEPQ